jgi:aspartate/methionine/tyrosine aminotransferase
MSIESGQDMPLELRRRVAAWWRVDESELALTLGTSHAFHLLCASRLASGDGCLVETPTYEMLRQLPGLFGASVGRIERRMEDGFRLPAELPDRIRRERPSMVLLSNPHNPSGVLLTLDELDGVASAARDVGAEMCVDEVYLPFLADAPSRSARLLGGHVAVASSLTKAYGLGTVRCGWLIADAARIDEALSYNDYISVLYPSPLAWVGLSALDHIDALQRRAVAARDDGLRIVDAWLETRRDVRWHRPEAGVIGFPALPMEDSAPFCAQLRARGTLVVPGGFFEAPSHVRLGFGVDGDDLRAGLCALGTALDELPLAGGIDPAPTAL